ncbi:MAG: type I-E CRISPR-associated protein Cse1/CasA [Anaerolineae bacterium]
MHHSFNLLDEAWVPCVALSGKTQELSLRDALVQSHAYRELGGENPLVTVSLYRLMLAILHRVFETGDEPEPWRDLWTRRQWDADALDAYLNRWHDRFDLFDTTRPFYQCRHPAANPKSVISLVQECASGNNPTLFDHSSEAQGMALSPAAASRAVVAAQAFGLAGLSPVSGERFTDGPAARGITLLVQGDTLFETLMLNLIPYPCKDVLGTRPERDCPAWEMDDPYAPVTRTPNGYLDYLTWQTRRVLLFPEDGPNGPVVRDMVLGPGLRFAVNPLDPLKHYRVGRDPKQGWLVLRFEEDHALWRDSAALFQIPPLVQRGQGRHLPPHALSWLQLLIEQDISGLNVRQTKRLIGLGMANDQAKVEFYRREEMPFPLCFLENQDLGKHVESALSESEDVGRQLWGALSSLAVQVLFHKEGAGLSRQEGEQRDALLRAWAGERRYWAALEIPFFNLLDALPKDPYAARDDWDATLRASAWRALDAVIAGLGEDPASLKAAVLARGQLGGGLEKVLGPAPSKTPLQQTGGTP